MSVKPKYYVYVREVMTGKVVEKIPVDSKYARKRLMNSKSATLDSNKFRVFTNG